LICLEVVHLASYRSRSLYFEERLAGPKLVCNQLRRQFEAKAGIEETSSGIDTPRADIEFRHDRVRYTGT
jgi:hypothetical protein